MRSAQRLRDLQDMAPHEDGCLMSECGCCCNCKSAEPIHRLEKEVQEDVLRAFWLGVTLARAESLEDSNPYPGSARAVANLRRFAEEVSE